MLTQLDKRHNPMHSVIHYADLKCQQGTTNMPVSQCCSLESDRVADRYHSGKRQAHPGTSIYHTYLRWSDYWKAEMMVDSKADWSVQLKAEQMADW